MTPRQLRDAANGPWEWIGPCDYCTAESEPSNGIVCAGHGLHYEDCDRQPRYPDDDAGWTGISKSLPADDRRPFVDDEYYRRRGVIK